MTPAQFKTIQAHGEKLLKIFPNAAEQDPIKLCKKLRKLERLAHTAAEGLCNTPGYEEQAEKHFASVYRQLEKLLNNGEGTDTPNVFINRDPRGYALKISAEYVRAFGLDIHRDWGGYGIVAPDLSEAK